MYRLILVDDEAEVREGMHRRIDWQSNGFEVVGEAENGREALELVEREMPDVVVTDISMPVMNGMELGKTLRERFPTVKTVFLTGYDEFSYAQQAIRMQAEEYVLKPVSASSMGELLLRLRTKLDAEIAQMEDLRQLREHYRQSLPLMRDKFLTTLMHRSPSREQLERAGTVDITLDAKAYMVAVVAVDESGLGQSEFRDDLDLARYAVLNMSEELVGRYLPHDAFLDADLAVLLLKLDEERPTEAYELVWTALENIRASVSRFLHFTVSVGVGTLVHSPEQIHIAFREAVNALDYRMVFGANRILYLADIEQHATQPLRLDAEQAHQLRLAVKVGETAGIQAAVDALFSPVLGSVASLAGTQAYLLGIVGLIVETAAEMGIDRESVLAEGETWLTPLTLETMEETRAWVTRTCTALGARVSGQRMSGTRQMVEQAKEYVRQHFAEESLSVPAVANMLHISPSYFSALYKKETGETFINLIMRIRMENARELLATTDMKTVEIAERVGYPDPHYFSYFFKKNMGVSPKEYRAGLKAT